MTVSLSGTRYEPFLQADYLSAVSFISRKVTFVGAVEFILPKNHDSSVFQQERGGNDGVTSRTSKTSRLRMLQYFC
ncbi:hypothetical protein J6590_046882 [Homalodisca vitripennis]|nr:hypothetical protein J6590_046882 [Homalodisca vitripennis]